MSATPTEPTPELIEKVRTVMEAEAANLQSTDEPKRILFTRMAEVLNNEGVRSHQDSEWNWQKIDAFVRRYLETG